MKKWAVAAAVGLYVLAASAPVLAQAGAAPRTCSQAYNQCFDACTARFPGGGEGSAKCIDKCAMARSQCDRSGCFKDEGIEACGLARQ